MEILIGFLVALAVGLTGIGGGSFTVPALVLLVGMPASVAVGTAFVYSAVVRLIAAPFYLAGKHVHTRYLWLLLRGAIPGVLIGTFLLRLLSSDAESPIVAILLGVLLAGSASIAFAPKAQDPNFAQRNAKWLPWLALPIGTEAGFSSAGAGALGTMLLLNYSDMTPREVVGTDLLFGMVLAGIGSAFHFAFGSMGGVVLVQLLEGGIPGVMLGCILARWVPTKKLKVAIAAIAIFAGLQLVWTGSRRLLGEHSTASAAGMAGTAHRASAAGKAKKPLLKRP